VALTDFALSWINSERCEDLRSLKSQRFTKDARRGQEYQMKEHEQAKEQEREVEKMWAEAARKEYEEKARQPTIFIYTYIYIKTKSVAFSPQANYTD
jgi:hypothetical protein